MHTAGVTELPTGTLTLLFSDIEGSTVLLHRLGSRWGEALTAQRRILRAAFGAHGGIEMGTEGDSFFVVFASARAALAAAVQGQRGLQAHHWPGDADVSVRMGIHTGEPQRHENGYVGEDVHRAARIGASANGAQIVLSDATHRLVEHDGDVAFRDLGRHRLKDLPGDHVLFDVLGAGLRSDFPALRSLGKPAALPTFATPLVGRDIELASVGRLFREQQARLVMVALLRGPLHTTALDAITAIDDDIRAALDWSLRPAGSDGRERVAAGHALLAVATAFWYRFGNVTDARRWQERGVAVADDEDTAENVTLLHSLGVSLLQQGEVDEAVALFDRSLAMAQRLGHGEFEARAYNDLGIARRQAGRYADALELLSTSLVISRAIGSATRVGTTLSNLVVVNIDLARYGDAVAAATEAMSVNAANGDDWSVAIDRLNYIAAQLRFEGPQAARASYAEWAEGIASFEDRELSIDLMEVGAGIAAGLGGSTLSARLLGGADAQRALIAMPRSPAEEDVMRAYVDSARERLTAAEWRRSYAAGAELAPVDAIRLVNALGAESNPN